MKQSITLIKLGGSIITDKNKEYTANLANIHQLAKEIKKSEIPVVIAHGSGSFGHTSAVKYGGMKGYKTKWGIAKVARDAMEINRIVMDVLLDEKLPVVSLRPMAMIVARSGKVESINFMPLLEILKQGLIPVVFGDVIWDKKTKSTIYSGEKTLNLIAEFLIKNSYKVEKIIEVSNTDGVLDEKGKTVEIINSKDLKKIKKMIVKNVNDVTGGMEHKVEEALRVAKIGIVTCVINGNRDKELLNALIGKKIRGTLIK